MSFETTPYYRRSGGVVSYCESMLQGYTKGSTPNNTTSTRNPQIPVGAQHGGCLTDTHHTHPVPSIY